MHNFKNIFPKVKDTLLFKEMDDGAVLYEPSKEMCYSLNTTSAYIWSLCDGKHSINEIINLIKQDFNEFEISPENAVEKIIKNFQVSNLLEKKFTIMLSIKLNNHHIKIQDDANLTNIIKNNVFSNAIKDSCNNQSDFKLFKNKSEFTLIDPWNELTSSISINEIIYSLEWKIVDFLIEKHTNFLQFHGASLSINDSGYAFIGNPGTGKTSMSILLMKNNFEFYSDEITLINPKTFEISPFPRNLIIKQHLLDTIQIPNDTLPLKIDGDINEKEIAYFLSPDIFGKTSSNLCKLKKIFFLHNNRNKEIKITKIGNHAAFNQLLPQLFNTQILNSSPNSIISLINEVECFNLYLSKPLLFDKNKITELLNLIV